MKLRQMALALDLKNDPQAIALYKSYHEKGGVPEAVLASIRNADVFEMEIFCVANRLFMLMTVGPFFDPEKKARLDSQDPEVQAWEDLMSRFQQPLPTAKAGEKWLLMDNIFRLTDHK